MFLSRNLIFFNKLQKKNCFESENLKKKLIEEMMFQMLN